MGADADLAEALFVADNRDRLHFKIFRIVEGQAVGRFAITVFALLVVAVLFFAAQLGPPSAYWLGRAVVNGAEAIFVLPGSIP